MKQMDPRALLDALRAGDRTALARAITVVESTHTNDTSTARALLRGALPFSGNSVRVGITGIPGAGKSTLIDRLGMRLVEQGHRVAVLAIDPSSTRTGGSILGDKTRMEHLSQHPHAFIRPTATGGTLGGVARRTRETIVLCEAAGYDRILIETVGIGQSELAVDRMTDVNLVLMISGAGDELQGIKRGIMEAADMIVLTKNDGGNKERVRLAITELQQAIQLLPPREHGARPTVLACSAQEDHGIAELEKAVAELSTALAASGYATAHRREQDRWWMSATIEERLLERFYGDARVSEAIARMEADVRAGSLSPFDAADELLDRYFGKG